MKILLTSVSQIREVDIKDETLNEIKLNISPIEEYDIPRKPGIYLLTCLVGEQKSYVGESLNIRKRIGYHRCSQSDKKTKTIIANAIKKYGWCNFEIRILEIFHNKTKFELLDLEEAYVAHYKLINKNIGYNVLARGRDRTGYKTSEKAKQKMSESHKGKRTGKDHHLWGKEPSEETKKKIGDGNRGKILNKESKDKISSALKGKYCGPNNWNFGRKQTLEHKSKSAEGHKKPVNQLNLETGEIIKTWATIKEISKFLSVGDSLIRKTCKNELKSAHGFGWSFVNT